MEHVNVLPSKNFKKFVFSSPEVINNSLKITLINPPSIISRYASVGELVPPIGLAYITSVLKQANHQVQIIDAIGENVVDNFPHRGDLVRRGISYEEIVNKIIKDTEIIGISGMFSSQWPHYKELIQDLKRSFPDALIIGGGEHFTAIPEYSLQTCPELDLCVLGEGEQILLDILNNISKGEELDNLTGIAFRKNNKIVVNSVLGRIMNIDQLPLPDWEEFPIENYVAFGTGWGVGKQRVMPIIATRGCPYQCTFCSSPSMWNTRWLPRDPEAVLDEIELYQKKYDLEEVQFYDLTAIIKKDWIIEFCKGIEKRGIKIAWQLPIGTRSEVVDSEVVDYLYRTGCTNMGFAPESGSPVTLKRIKKRVNLKNMKASMRGCVKRGLNVKANIIIGFPGETHKEIWESMKFAFQSAWIGIHDMSFFPFSPYPGSELFRTLQNQNKIPEFSDEWFLSLSYVELGKFNSYCENVSKKMLHFYQIFGFSLFYGSQYLFRPWRLLKTVYNLVRGKHESKGEQALDSLIKRIITKRVQVNL